jgi:DNA-binding IscR family transcriptional regulator
MSVGDALEQLRNTEYRTKKGKPYRLTVAAQSSLDIVMERCMLGTAPCSEDRACPRHEFWSKARRQVTDFLRLRTIRDMATFQTRESRRLVLAP